MNNLVNETLMAWYQVAPKGVSAAMGFCKTPSDHARILGNFGNRDQCLQRTQLSGSLWLRIRDLRASSQSLAHDGRSVSIPIMMSTPNPVSRAKPDAW
ncbi:hypothetical protein [Bradyrhizobium sp. WSM1743]|uniref:hypothetical protein n=1 Tax=Bradyrhizobium sp. WSM1743 TaxID=318996 RepID=UPI00048259AF|nr:hypothetical protein [Bradyrhizobium sp. WSM1743]